jgi:hypothetical protein
MAVAGGRTAFFLGAFVVVSTVVAPGRATGQPAAGGFEDATIPRRGEARFRISATFDASVDQFGTKSGATGRFPLGRVLTFDSLGAAQLPAVGVTQRFLRDSLGVSSGLSLGSVQTDSRVLTTSFPLRLEFGLTSRVALDARVPIVRTRNAVRLGVNNGGGTGNLGFNPSDSRFASGTAAAVARNAAVQAQLAAAITRLQGLVTSCSTPAGAGGAGCAPVIANRAGATQLITEARTAANGITSVYGNGTATGTGTPFVPVAGSDAQRAVEARLTALRTRFTSFNVSDLGSGTAPAGATERIANSGFRRILGDPLLGFAYDTTFSVERGGLGDVEVGARFKWLDMFGESRLPVSGFHARSTAGVAYRLGTSGTDLPFLLFDVPLGTGADALIFRSETDIASGRRLGATIAARWVRPLADEAVVRVPLSTESILAPAARTQTVGRHLGRELTLEVTPRWAPSESFTIAAQYSVTTKQDDAYAGTFTVTDEPFVTTDTFDAAVLGVATGGRAQRFGFGATYSTLAARARGRAGLPIEVSYLHTSTVAGSGGVVPRVTTDALVLRLYAQLFGRGRRAR